MDDLEEDMSMDGVEVEIKSPASAVSPGKANISHIIALKTIAGRWKKKAVKAKDLNLAFSDSPQVGKFIESLFAWNCLHYKVTIVLF